MARLTLALLAAFAVGTAQAQSMRGQRQRLNFKAVGQAGRGDVDALLGAELADHGERMARLEEELRVLFTSLPKTQEGNLGHQAVRYALHRFFLNRHGWFIRGLEPSHSQWTPQNNASFVKEWVPSYLQDLLERRVGEKGAALHEVAAMAAALEDLIQKEARVRLATVYEAHGVKAEDSLEQSEAVDVLMTYYMSFLVANNFTVGSYSELLSKKHRFTQGYRNYTEAKDWFDSVVDRHFVGEPSKTYDFKATSAVVTDISENFYSFNERECSSLKNTLSGMESRKPGRVRLSTFYNMTRYSHWRFTERPEYLRSLGALDESDPKNPSVIIPNYAMARPNCLDAFHLFTICCRNACEDMMGSLERALGAAEAEPARILELVAALPSESVAAPRELPASLALRLGEIAALHGGRVPIHGRLFAQWMHHVYPLECPFPHEQGLNPQTASEWMEETGHASTEATAEEMRKAVESDSCAVDWKGRSECEDESTDLPWVMEERLITHGGSSGGAAARAGSGFLKVVLAAAALFAAAAAALRLRRGGDDLCDSLHEGRALSKGVQNQEALAKIVLLVSAGTLGYCSGLLDGLVVAGFTLQGVILVAVIGGRRRSQTKLV